MREIKKYFDGFFKEIKDQYAKIDKEQASENKGINKTMLDSS